MPCLLIGVSAIFPRIALVLMWLVGYTATAFVTVLWPLIGFFLAPFTTCAYAIGMNQVGGFQGWTLLLLIVGVLLDFGAYGGTGRGASRYRRRMI